MIVLALAACAPDTLGVPVTETGNPERNLGVAAIPLPPPPSDADTVDSAWAALGEIKLVLDERYAGEHELEWETPEVVAQLTDGPVDLKFRSPSLGYSEVVVRPRDGGDAPGAPAELEDASFVVDGTRADGTPFHLVSDTREEVTLRHPFELGDEQHDLALGVDTDAWLEGLDLAGAQVVGGEIRIDADTDPVRLARFEANLARSFTLVDDLDADGQATDADEVLVPLP